MLGRKRQRYVYKMYITKYPSSSFLMHLEAVCVTYGSVYLSVVAALQSLESGGNVYTSGFQTGNTYAFSCLSIVKIWISTLTWPISDCLHIQTYIYPSSGRYFNSRTYAFLGGSCNDILRYFGRVKPFVDVLFRLSLPLFVAPRTVGAAGAAGAVAGRGRLLVRGAVGGAAAGVGAAAQTCTGRPLRRRPCRPLPRHCRLARGPPVLWLAGTPPPTQGETCHGGR